jgi:hypothetical protein
MQSESDDLFAAVRGRDYEQACEILKRRPESARARDSDGATALHYAAEIGDQKTVKALLDAGADINARDLQFGATPTGWAIEYLRQRGGLLGIEIEDAKHAIANGDQRSVQRYLARFPALRVAADRGGTALREHALNCGNDEVARLFGHSVE